METRQRVRLGERGDCGVPEFELPHLLSIQRDGFARFLQQGVDETLASFFPMSDVAGRYQVIIRSRTDEPSLPPKYEQVRDACLSGRTLNHDVRLEITVKDCETDEERHLNINIPLPVLSEAATIVIGGKEKCVMGQQRFASGVFFEEADEGGWGIRRVKGKIIPERGDRIEIDNANEKHRIMVKVGRRKTVPLTSLLITMGLIRVESKVLAELSRKFESEIIEEISLSAGESLMLPVNATKKMLADSAAFREVVSHYDLNLEIERRLIDGIAKGMLESSGDTGANRMDNEIVPLSQSVLVEEALARLLCLQIEKISNRAGLNKIEKETLEWLSEQYKNLLGAGIAIELSVSSLNVSKASDDDHMAAFEGLELAFSDPSRFKLGRSGRAELCRKLRVRDIDKRQNLDLITPDEFLEFARYLSGLVSHDEDCEFDDADHLAHRQVRGIGRTYQEIFCEVLSDVERDILWAADRGALTDLGAVCDCLSSMKMDRSFLSKLKKTGLLQSAEQANPLASIVQKRAISSLGKGKAASAHILDGRRDVQPSQYGRLCPVDVPESKRAGITNALALYSRENPDGTGLLETPYYAVRDSIDDVSVSSLEYCDAWGEAGKTIACFPVQPYGDGHRARSVEKRGLNWVPVDAASADLDYMEVSPKQMLSVGAALIPFIEHDDAARALMGARMQAQAVPLMRPQAPYVGTGLEGRVLRDSGLAIMAEHDGVIDYSDKTTVIIKHDSGYEEHLMPVFEPTAQGTCSNHRAVFSKGDSVKTGEFLTDGCASDGGELALGHNLLVAYMSWEGYGFEDGIVISERVNQLDLLTSFKTWRITVDIYKGDAMHLCRSVGDDVSGGDWLVRGIRGSGEDRYVENNPFFGAEPISFKDVPCGVSGTIRSIHKITPGNSAGVVEQIVFDVVQKRKVCLGDKLAGRHGNKGTVTKIAPIEDMPFLSDGTPIDVILNPLGVPSRMNVGQLLEAHLGWAAVRGGDIIKDAESPRDLVARRYEVPAFESPSIDEIGKAILDANSSFRSNAEGFYGKSVPEYLIPQLSPDTGKVRLFDGKSGEEYDQDVSVGYAYIMRLNQYAADKIAARSGGPGEKYDPRTGQPVKGRWRRGGLRFGEMENWALEAYGAKHLIVEMNSVRADDSEGRTRLKDEIEETGKYCFGSRVGVQPGSVDAVVKTLQSLCFNVDPCTNLALADEVSVSLASSDQVRAWSCGEVTTAEVKAEKRGWAYEAEGLMSESIFGPRRSYKCACGGIQGIEHKGEICGHCGTTVISKDARRLRLGHIELASPVLHPWYQCRGDAANLLPLVLGIEPRVFKLRSIEEVRLALKQIDEAELDRTISSLEGSVAALRKAIGKFSNSDSRISLKKIKGRAKKENRLRYESRRLDLLRGMRESGARPDDVVLDVIPVLPAGLRPEVRVGDKDYDSDITILYQGVIRANDGVRFWKSCLAETQDDDSNIRAELKKAQDVLQRAVNALFDFDALSSSDQRDVMKTMTVNRPLQSLGGTLKGKTGLARKGGLLGRRVDYSGRAVITVNPDLRADQCGLPVSIAEKLFEPFVNHEMRTNGLIGQSKIDALRKAMEGKLVLLNRAPTLHRMGVQAFDPVLVTGSSIQIHPLVCSAFNADFDGDTMQVYLPMSVEGQSEAHEMVLAHHPLSPAHGGLVMDLTQDMVMGLYWLTSESPIDTESQEPYFADEIDAVRACLSYGAVGLRQPVRVTSSKCNEYVTTVGRLIFNMELPDYVDYINSAVGKDELSALLNSVAIKSLHGDMDKLGNLLQRLMELGFRYAEKSGISLSAFDMHQGNDGDVASRRERIVEAVKDRTRDEDSEAKTDSDERLYRMEARWSKVSEYLIDKTLSSFEGENPMRIMVESGARGSRQQLGQVSGVRGLMNKLSGGIVDIPIASNLRDGLDAIEYFVSAYGSRKGIVDRSVRTAEPGDLARNIMDSVQACVISSDDCGTDEGVELPLLDQNGIPNEELIGRCVLNHVEMAGKALLDEGCFIESRDKIQELLDAGLRGIVVRSALKCKAERGVCRRCYGWDPSTHEPAGIGTPVGIIAAQSVSEPGTQMIMKTFHTGGAAASGGDVSTGLSRAEELFKARRPKAPAVLAEYDGTVSEEVVSELDRKVFILDSDDNECSIEYQKPGWMKLAISATNGGIHVEKGQRVTIGSLNLEDAIRIWGEERAVRYLVDELCGLYKEQGAKIDRRHFELIVHSMCQTGDDGRLHILGTDKVSKESESWLASMSFQGVKRVLSRAALVGRTDKLVGIKENAMLGRRV